MPDALQPRPVAPRHGAGAIVLLITDRLDRGEPEALLRATERLRLSARRLIWMNPLPRFDGFAPGARGIAAMMPHVDSFRAGHDIAPLEGLAEAIARARRDRREGVLSML